MITKSHKRIRLWSMLLAALAASLVQAQQQALTLDECVRLALEAPSLAQAADREQAIARERQTAARSEMLPQFGLNAGHVYNSPSRNGPTPFSFVALNGVREYLSTADANWSVDLSGRLRAGLALARAGRDIAAADLAVAKRDLRRAVSLAYYDLLLARRIAGLEEGSVKEALEFERKVRARLGQGEASRADLLKATSQRSQFEQRLSQARLDARLANQILASFWTTDSDRELLVEDVLDASTQPPPDGRKTGSGKEAMSIPSRPELRRLDALGRSFDAQRKVARAGLRPEANVIFQYGLDANQVSVNQRGYAAYVNLSVPVFDWFKTRSGVREANYRHDQVELQRASAERGFTREFLAARARVQSWHERIPIAQSGFDDSNENLRLVRLLYDSGEAPALDVVLSREQATQAGRTLYSAKAQYRRSLADFEVAAGR